MNAAISDYNFETNCAYCMFYVTAIKVKVIIF